MGQTLTNGIFLPNEGERNCYTGLAGNWRAIDGYIGDYNVHIADAVIHVSQADRDKWDAVDNKADASALTAHTGDTTIHVTAEDKQAWNDHIADTVKHVTAEDKATWNTVTSKAKDSDVVHKSGNETVDGLKTFLKYITSDGSSTGDEYSSNTRTNLWLMGNRDKEEVSGVLFDTYRQNTAQGTGIHILGISIKENSVRYEGCRWGWYWDNNLNGYTFDFKPTTQGANQALKHNLGTSTDKWSTINGLNPSSLSLPSSARIDISSYFTNTGTGQSNSYTVPANGYIYLTLSELTNVHCFSRASGNVINYAQTFTKLSDSTGALYVLFPVRKNDIFVATWYTTTTVSVDGAFFIPCQGNI